MTLKNNEEEKKRIEQERKIKALLNLSLDPNAYDRIMNVKLANEELYYKAAQMIFTLFQRKGRKIKEEELISILKMIKGDKNKQGKITFMRK